jgi:membrane protein YdbS with pleckstrin-like domain
MRGLSGILPVVAAALGARKRLTRTLAGGAAIALCLLIAAGFLILGAYQALALALAPPWAAVVLGAGFAFAALVLKGALDAMTRRAERHRRAEPDPLALAAAGFVLGVLTGPDRAERSD